jgi:hypothetical protein
MARGVPANRRRADLTGKAPFWLAIGVSFCAIVPFALFPRLRPWLGCALLLMWACFFTANAVLSRRTHSVLSAPVYALAAAALAGKATGYLEVEIWMVWVLGAGILAANLSERVLGKYL